MTAGSAPATARNTILRGAFAKARRRPIWKYRPTNSLPTPRSGSVEGNEKQDGRTRPISTEEPDPEMVRAPLAGAFLHARLLRLLSGAAQFELLVDLRRHPQLHAGGADRHRHRAGDALYADRERSF